MKSSFTLEISSDGKRKESVDIYIWMAKESVFPSKKRTHGWNECICNKHQNMIK
jgi:hypothetical protein